MPALPPVIRAILPSSFFCTVDSTVFVVIMCESYLLPKASASARELVFLVPPSDATKGRIPLSLRGEFLLPPLGQDLSLFHKSWLPEGSFATRSLDSALRSARHGILVPNT